MHTVEPGPDAQAENQHLRNLIGAIRRELATDEPVFNGELPARVRGLRAAADSYRQDTERLARRLSVRFQETARAQARARAAGLRADHLTAVTRKLVAILLGLLLAAIGATGNGDLTAALVLAVAAALTTMYHPSKERT